MISQNRPMIIEIITLFPEGIGAILNESMLKRAENAGAVQFELVQLRDFTHDKHSTADDRPFGGGPGMVLKAQPIAEALEHLQHKRPDVKPHVILTSPQGRVMTQEVAEELTQRDRLTLICGHYKGVDQRAIDRFVDEEISIGDYILTGGELPAAVIVDSVVRLLPGVLGDPASAAGDSFSSGLLDHPHYTQPADWDGEDVPDVLTSGHHKNVEEWRLKKRIERTKKLRPDLYEHWLASQSGRGSGKKT
jgi:tRNA (guanine37-N1)-methyltransferase